MKIKQILALVAAGLLVSACFSSSSDDDDDSGLSDKDRAQAAASASVLSGSVDDPDDDDDDGDGSPMSRIKHMASQGMTRCDSGSFEEGAIEGADVGSPYTADGTLDINWSYYQECVQEFDEMEATTDGYQEVGNEFGSDVHFFRFAATPEDPMGEEGVFFTEWPGFGAIRFSGYWHECEGCIRANEFGTVGIMEMDIEAAGEHVVTRFGQSGSPAEVEGEWVSESDALVSENGFRGLRWDGTPCDLEVEINTREAFYWENYDTPDARRISGVADMTVGNSTFTLEFSDGQAYLDGEPFDPEEDNPCAGAFEIMNAN